MFTLFAYNIFTQIAFADLPVEIDGNATKKGELLLDLGVGYRMSDSEQYFLDNQNELGLAQIESHTINTYANLSYGLTKQTDAYLNAALSKDSSRITNQYLNSDKSSITSKSLDLGINHLMDTSQNLPKILLNAEGNIFNHTGNIHHAFHHIKLEARAISSNDPLVFSIGIGGVIRFPKNEQLGSFKQGNNYFINPNMLFVVNSKDSIWTGVTINHQQSSSLDEKTLNPSRTGFSLSGGVGHSLNKTSTLRFRFDTDVSGKSGSGVQLSLSKSI